MFIILSGVKIAIVALSRNKGGVGEQGSSCQLIDSYPVRLLEI
ncbi:hypothetical protein GXM_10071 [Nostoc sphaeroides CCNUC1]|uniref:Uncharacterized protein n=1 Tax=Nostoc sphaeroides CCNUC1 TaxID=2653204 RepID=A0A5P8WIW9_9NOSO|nr:hypothetical protein GXM_10071 [Nostoc sphaeroides CCNUC1]